MLFTEAGHQRLIRRAAIEKSNVFELGCTELFFGHGQVDFIHVTNVDHQPFQEQTRFAGNGAQQKNNVSMRQNAHVRAGDVVRNARNIWANHESGRKEVGAADKLIKIQHKQPQHRGLLDGINKLNHRVRRQDERFQSIGGAQLERQTGFVDRILMHLNFLDGVREINPANTSVQHRKRSQRMILEIHSVVLQEINSANGHRPNTASVHFCIQIKRITEIKRHVFLIIAAIVIQRHRLLHNNSAFFRNMSDKCRHFGWAVTNGLVHGL